MCSSGTLAGIILAFDSGTPALCLARTLEKLLAGDWHEEARTY